MTTKTAFYLTYLPKMAGCVGFGCRYMLVGGYALKNRKMNKPKFKMKKYIILLSLIYSLILSSCSSPMKYQNSMFNKTYYENKTICFLLSENCNNIQIIKEGPNRGETKTPDNKETFKKSIENLALESKLNIKFIYSEKDLLSNEILVKVDIKEIKWIFGFSTLTMNSNIHYELNNNGKIYKIIGTHKTSMGGSKEWNLFHSLKNANYLFLKEIEKT